jgi:predicted SnoaL-like aldol condensation-catalyzing enzyme
VVKTAISREDIVPMDIYARERSARRQRVGEHKRLRRLPVGPDITFHFESYETMLHQIHEMLFIERGGEAQIEDELRAYNPLVPDGRTLVATMMIEIEDPLRRARVLRELSGIEGTISLTFDGMTVVAEPEGDIDRTSADGKTSSVHFFKFRFTPEQIARFCRTGTRVLVAIAHPAYDHMAAFPEAMRAAVSEDFARVSH